MFSLTSKYPVRVGGACWVWKIGTVVQYSLWVIFCYWNFCFHVVKTQMPTLALLPFLCILKNSNVSVISVFTVARTHTQYRIVSQMSRFGQIFFVYCPRNYLIFVTDYISE